MENTPNASYTPWFAVSLGLMGIMVGYSVASMKLSSTTAQLLQQPSIPEVPTEPAAPMEAPPAVTAADHLRGDANAAVTILEYSDFQCPFCGRVNPTLDQLLEEYDGKVNLVFRHFPLSFHPFAQKAAEASECAADQGGNDSFWKYHDALFVNQASFSDSLFVTLAADMGLDETSFKDCLDTGKYAGLVEDHMTGASPSGVRGTPASFIINNATKEFEMISGAVPIENFKSAIDPLL